MQFYILLLAENLKKNNLNLIFIPSQVAHGVVGLGSVRAKLI